MAGVNQDEPTEEREPIVWVPSVQGRAALLYPPTLSDYAKDTSTERSDPRGANRKA